MAFRFPGDVADEDAFWRLLSEGKDVVTEIDPQRWATEVLQHPRRTEPGRSVTFSAGVLSGIEQFDAGFFGISPREAAWLDPQQRLLLELAWEATENGGVPASRLAGSNCAVFVGISGLDYGVRGLDDLATLSAYTMTGNTLSIAANRLSYVFDLHGPSMAIDTACSSSLIALHQACNCLRMGEAGMAMVGGVNVLMHPYPFIGFSKASMLSAGGRCRTFDAAGDGYVRAEGGVVLLLKPMDKALADGDRIHAVILASGANADGGRKTGLTIPSRDGQIELMRTVLARSEVTAADVDYLEAHGTGTAIGDPIETSAIGAVYGQARPALRPLPIGSVKTNLGHLEPASGMAGLIKALLVVKHRQIPPSIHVEVANPAIDFDGLNLQPVSQTTLLADEGRPLIVGVNSFGFGGANGHVLIQGYEHRADVPVQLPDLLPPLILSARSRPALQEMAERYAKRLEGATAADYYDVAYSTVYRRERLEQCLALAPRDVVEAAELLGRFASGEVPAGLVVENLPEEPGKLAFIFSGNGAQWKGMGQRLFTEDATFRGVLNDLAARIEPLAGFSLINELLADESDSRMNETAVAQPLLFAVQVALTEMLRKAGIEADAVAGHSVGEVAAAWAAGALSLDEAVRVICARSMAQALAHGSGRMAAVVMPALEMQALLARQEWLDLEIAGFNSPENLTLSGPQAQLEALGALLKQQGVVFRMLDLEYAFHSRFMEPVRGEMERILGGFNPGGEGRVVFVSTVTGDVCNASLDSRYWWDNVRQPVQFNQAMLRLVEFGCRVFVEISPHAILQRYIKECVAETQARAVILPSLRKGDNSPGSVSELVLRLSLLCSRDALKSCFPTVGRFVNLPSYPWQRERHWLPRTSEGYGLIERNRIHPLLGWSLKDAPMSWENVLDPYTHPWLADHCIGGAIVLPGAAYVEMALAAACEWREGETQELEELDIVAPVVFDGEHGRSLRLDLNVRDGSFEIRSRQRLSEDEWTLNASGRLLGGVTGYTAAALLPLPEPVSMIDPDTHYRLARSLNLDYGPAFQAMAEVQLAGHLLEGRLEARGPLGASPQASWSLDPGMLDACFQSLLDFFREEIEAGVGLPLLPVKIGRLRLLQLVPFAFFRTRILRRGLRSVLAEFELFAADGTTVAVLSGCRFRAASLGRGKLADPACWRIHAVMQPGVLASSGNTFPSLARMAEEIRDVLSAREGELDRAAYFGEVQPLIDALVTAFAFEAAETLRRDGGPGSGWVDEAASVSAEHWRLVLWVRDLLVENGCLRQNVDGKWVLEDGGLPSSAEIWRTILADYPASLPELVLLGRFGRGLATMLAGQVEPQVLFREVQRSHQLETLYDDSITYRASRVATEMLLTLLAGALPDNRRLRVLEIAAGVSEVPRGLGASIGTSRVDYVLAHPDGDRCDALRHEYQDDPWVTVAELEIAPVLLKAKSALPAHYDVLVLRHSIASMEDPRALLAWARAQLAAGGVLVLVERHPDLASELIRGPFRLAAAQVWASELAELGFTEVEICREPEGEDSPVGCYMLLARCAPQNEPNIEPNAARWLVLARGASESGLLDAAQERLVSYGQHVACALYDHELSSLESARNWIDKQIRRLEGPPDHCLWMAGIREGDDISPSVEGLNLVRALTSLVPEARLNVVTQGCAPVDGVFQAADWSPAAMALWGFGRVVMNEYPGLACRLIDIAPLAPPDVQAGLLVDELLYPDGEVEVLLSPEARRALRMDRIQLPDSVQAFRDVRYCLDFRVPGQLRNLLWLQQQDVALKEGEVEVRPHATGLNFRDVMYVMGLLPDEAVEHGFAGASLGLEFSGVVTQVGPGVLEFAPGDAVMGFGSACFASHVVTRASVLTPKPTKWSFESAATVPTVFFTVYYALRQLANLQPGERVLVHGGAGGVGIAAVQLARLLGAEVFATAGSAEKRDFVALLGADHVFDSRSLAFADQILAATGGEGVDVVLNSLAGEAIRRNLRVLRPFGRFLELGKRDFFENTPIGLRPFKDNISYFGIDADQLLIARPDLAARLFQEVMTLFKAGGLSPLPFRTFSAERVVDAFRYMQQAKQIGKVVVSFDGVRIAPQPLLPRVAPPRFERTGSYLVTGGLSGFGLETARWLALHGAGHIVLLSRRGMETPDAAAAVASIEECGAEVTVKACDVTHREALKSVLDAPGLPPLKGVFHAAMVIDDALIANLDAERMTRVLAPKVQGAWLLHELTQPRALDHFVLYSSVTTSIGNPGQANYVAANAWLEGLAIKRRAMGLTVTCVGWGPIGDAGYLTRNKAVKDSLASRLGAEPLSADNALRMLGRILQQGHPENIVVADFQFDALARLLPSTQGPRFSALRRQGGSLSGERGSLDDFRALIEGKSESEVRDVVAGLVTQEVAQTLAISAERVDSGRSLHDLGLDSLMGVELALGLEKRFGIQIPAMLLNEGPSVERITARIVERLMGTADTAGGGESALAEAVAIMAAQHGESVSADMVDTVASGMEVRNETLGAGLQTRIIRNERNRSGVPINANDEV